MKNHDIRLQMALLEKEAARCERRADALLLKRARLRGELARLEKLLKPAEGVVQDAAGKTES